MPLGLHQGNDVFDVRRIPRPLRGNWPVDVLAYVVGAAGEQGDHDNMKHGGCEGARHGWVQCTTMEGL